VDLLCDVVDEASSTVLAIFWLVVDVFFVGDKKIVLGQLFVCDILLIFVGLVVSLRLFCDGK
jgi:hypothetical protein